MQLQQHAVFRNPPLEDSLQRLLGGRYQICRELFGGGMSRLFVAYKPTLDRSRAESSAAGPPLGR